MKRLLSPLVLALSASPALAHLDPVAHSSFLAGATHPLLGLDHILAMVAVGLWAATLGGRAWLFVPAAFMVVMAVGYAIALAGIGLPLVEPMILASTVVLGLVAAAAVKVDVRYAGALVGLFAIFHGHAHGGELGQAGAASFGLGFLLATIALHAAGIAVVICADRIAPKLGSARSPLVCGIGGAVAFAGLGLMLT